MSRGPYFSSSTLLPREVVCPLLAPCVHLFHSHEDISRGIEALFIILCFIDISWCKYGYHFMTDLILSKGLLIKFLI